MQYIISVDIGTTALKASLLVQETPTACGNPETTNGADHKNSYSGSKLLAATSRDYPLMATGNSITQDPELWWQAFCAATKELLHTYPDIVSNAVVLSGQMQDLIQIENGKLSGPAILYSDTSAQQEYEDFCRAFGFEEIREITKNTPDASGLPAKIRRLFRKGCISSKTQFLLGAHDYVCWKLTGSMVTDPTNASTTGLMNYTSMHWEPSFLSYLGITPAQLPVIELAGTITGIITPEAAELSGLPSGIPIIHGAGDAAASTIGAGAGIPGIYSCYLGTSGWIAATVPAPVDPAYGVFNLKHPNGKETICIGAMRTTGGNISWLMETFGIPQKYEELQELAEQAKPGSSGLIYLPYLQGERSPFQDPYACGAFIGLRRATGRPELFRAVLEGIAYGLAALYEKLALGTGASAQYVVASGGGAENKLLTNIISSVCNLPVLIPEDSSQNGVLGSLIIAGVALSWFDDYRAVPLTAESSTAPVQTETSPLGNSRVAIAREVFPDAEAHAVYSAYQKVFNALYPALQKEFKEIAKIQN